MSSEFLRRLSIQLGIDTAVFEEGLHEAKHLFKETMEGLTKSAVVDGELIAEGLKEGFEKIKEMGEEAIEQAAQLGELAKRYGLTTEAMSAYAYAAKMTGVDTETVATGFRKLNQHLVEAASGQGKAAGAFHALGIAVKDAHGHLKNSDEVMQEVAEKFAGFQDGAVKTALAVDIFGRSGDALIPMLDEGKEGLSEMALAAQKAGLILNDDAAESAHEFERQTKAMKLTLEGAATRVAIDLLPTFKMLGRQFQGTGNDAEFLEGVAKTLEFTLKALVSVAKVAMAVFRYVGDEIAATAATLNAIAHGEFKEALRIMADSQSYEDAAQSIAGIAEVWKEDAEAATHAAEAHHKAKAEAPDYGKEKKEKDSSHKDLDRAQKELEQVERLLKSKRELEDADYAAQRQKIEEALHFRLLSREQANTLEVQLAQHHRDILAQISEAEAAPFKQQQEQSEKEIAALRQKLLSKRQLEEANFAHEVQQVQNAEKLKTLTTAQSQALIEQLTEAHQARLKAIDDEALAARLKNLESAVSFTENALNAIGQQQAQAASAARAISKAQALARIAHDTPAAAMAAATAVASIPIVGPTLAPLAAAAMYALGAASVASVMSESPSTTPRGSNFSVSSAAQAAGGVTPVSTQTPAAPAPTTIIRIPENALMTGRQIIDYINEAMADGKPLTHLQVMPA